MSAGGANADTEPLRLLHERDPPVDQHAGRLVEGLAAPGLDLDLAGDQLARHVAMENAGFARIP